MGIWDDLVNTVANAVEEGVNTVTDVVSDVVETAGNLISDGLNALGNAASNIPVVGGVISGILQWAGGVVSTACDLAATCIKAAGAMVAGALGGAIKIVGGLLGLNPGLIGSGLLDIISGIAGAFVVFGGESIALIQATLFLQSNERPLTPAEHDMLQRIYRDSLALYNIRIVEGRYGVFGVNNSSFTLGNTIYLKNNTSAILVHESLHVWQNQHLGSRYASDAIGAQWFVQNPYSWQDEISRGNTDWVNFNREAQAQFVEDIFVSGDLLVGGSVSASGNGVFYDADGTNSTGSFKVGTTDHTTRANDAVTEIRGKRSFRLSQLIG